MGISGKWTPSNYSEAVKATIHAGCLAILVKLSQENWQKGPVLRQTVFGRVVRTWRKGSNMPLGGKSTCGLSFLDNNASAHLVWHA